MDEGRLEEGEGEVSGDDRVLGEFADLADEFEGMEHSDSASCLAGTLAQKTQTAITTFE